MPQGHTPLGLIHFLGPLWSALFLASSMLIVKKVETEIHISVNPIPVKPPKQDYGVGENSSSSYSNSRIQGLTETYSNIRIIQIFVGPSIPEWLFNCIFMLLKVLEYIQQHKNSIELTP